MGAFGYFINFSDPSVRIALCSVIFAPILWNAVLRLQLKTKIISKFLCGNQSAAFYMTAFVIFWFSMSRDFRVDDAMDAMPKAEFLGHPAFNVLAVLLIVLGCAFVIGAFMQLGITGIYGGEYFGLELEEAPSGFPFGWSRTPTYTGSTMNFVGFALWKQSPVGLFLALIVYLMYRLALRYERPFLRDVYGHRRGFKRLFR
eukprot:TRINITY_DN8352_c0_g1_i2.p1 TRINITY_DN8352_c0_g1~~TRINITY_DN8352_c0_g1_i2.p1  ORF type:complete len:211 (-),score=8.57 TRINITY_DN8352_c0_g1_i2:628-1230(-)